MIFWAKKFLIFSPILERQKWVVESEWRNRRRRQEKAENQFEEDRMWKKDRQRDGKNVERDRER